MESVVIVVESAIGVYLLAGLVLLVPIHRWVVPTIDHQAEGASWGFRVAVSPGLVALWPLVLRKGLLARRKADPHGSPDRPVSSLAIRRLQSVLIKVLAIAIPLLLAAALYFRNPPVSSSIYQEVPGEASNNGR